MKQAPIKLGPLALLLTVIAICLTTLSVLTFSTAQADLNLASKQAQTVKTRYALESEGQRFLHETYEAIDAGALADGDIEKTLTIDDMTLTVSLTVTGGELDVTAWRIEKGWEENDEAMENLWQGFK